MNKVLLIFIFGYLVEIFLESKLKNFKFDPFTASV